MEQIDEMLLKQAVEEVNERARLGAQVPQIDPEAGEHPWDALITIPGRDLKYGVEVKRELRRAQAGAIINQLRHYGELADLPPLLVADYINPKLAQTFREAGIQYLDTAGNAYIDHDPLFIMITGEKMKLFGDTIGLDAPNAPQKTGKGFKQAGLKIIFALLRDQHLVARTYRDIAAAAGVALGAVGTVLQDLQAQKYIADQHLDGKQRRVLQNKDKLIEKWAEHYPYGLRRNLGLGTFMGGANGWWEEFDITAFGAVWGGELAAAKYTKYLKPVDIEIYVDKEQMNGILSEARLRRFKANEARAGRVMLFEKFWEGEGEWEERGLAHPVLVYADLLETADPRNLDTAKQLREQFLDRA